MKKRVESSLYWKGGIDSLFKTMKWFIHMFLYLFANRSLHRRNSEHFAEEAVKESTDRIRATRDCEEDYTFSEVVGVYAWNESITLFFATVLVVISNCGYLYISLTTVFLAQPDCGLSVRWEPTEGTEACCEFSPANIKETWTDPEREVLQELVSVMQFSENGLKARVVFSVSPILTSSVAEKITWKKSSSEIRKQRLAYQCFVMSQTVLMPFFFWKGNWILICSCEVKNVVGSIPPGAIWFVCVIFSVFSPWDSSKITGLSALLKQPFMHAFCTGQEEEERSVLV